MIAPTEVIDGAMLSDAGITSPYNASHFSMALSGAGHIDWLRVVKAALSDLGINVCTGHPRLLSRVDMWGRCYVYCYMKTRTSQFINDEHERWYSEGRKEAPEDLLLTPVSLAHWFTGDGNSCRSTRSCTVTVSLCSQSYGLRSIVFLEEQLQGLELHTGRAFKRVNEGAGIVLTINQDSVDRFMSIVEPYVVPSYEYKVVYRTDIKRHRPSQALWETELVECLQV